jgi:hypothetical protein
LVPSLVNVKPKQIEIKYIATQFQKDEMPTNSTVSSC